MTCRYCGLERTERNQTEQCMNRAPTERNLRPTHEWSDWKPLPPEKRPMKVVYPKDEAHGG